MKKVFVALVIILSLVSSLAIPAFAAQDEILVYLDGNKLNFDVSPTTINGSTLVPMRTIFESLKYTISWNPDIQQVVAENSNRKITMQINSKQATINDKTVTLDVAPIEINGRTLVPLRFVGEASGYNVTWDSSTKSVYIGAAPTTQTPPNSNADPKQILRQAINQFIASYATDNRGTVYGTNSSGYWYDYATINSDYSLSFPSDNEGIAVFTINLYTSATRATAAEAQSETQFRLVSSEKHTHKYRFENGKWVVTERKHYDSLLKKDEVCVLPICIEKNLENSTDKLYRAQLAVDDLKLKLKNPSSLILNRVRVYPNSTAGFDVVEIDYSAMNSYGGYSREFYYYPGGNSESDSIIDEYGYEYTTIPIESLKS